VFHAALAICLRIFYLFIFSDVYQTTLLKLFPHDAAFKLAPWKLCDVDFLKVPLK